MNTASGLLATWIFLAFAVERSSLDKNLRFSRLLFCS